MKKFFIVLGIILGVIILLGGAFAGGMAYLVSYNNSYKGEYKTVFKNESATNKKAMVIYQPSRSKISDKIAEEIGKGLSKSGYEVTLNYPGQHLSINTSEYSLIVFGSPVFGGQPSKMILDSMNNIKDCSGIKTAVYSVGAMQESPELDILEGGLKGAKIIKRTKFKASDKGNLSEAYNFGIDLGNE